MDIRDLRFFILCAELGGLHKAAEHAGRSQPALSKCIARLESELGTRLFAREGRGLRLTAAGETLLTHAKRLSHGLDIATREVGEAADGSVGHVRIGSGPTAAESLLPGIFGQALLRWPRLTFEVSIGLTNEMRRALQEGRLDFIVGPRLEGDSASLDGIDIGTDVMVVAARAGHPLAGRRVACEELAPYGWLLPPTLISSTSWIQQKLAAHGVIMPVPQVQVSSTTPLRHVIGATDLLSSLSRRDLHSDAGLVEIDVPELVRPRDFAVLWPRHGDPSVAALRMIELIGELGPGLLAG